MAAQVKSVLQAACATDGGLVSRVNALVDNLDDLLRQEGFDPTTSKLIPGQSQTRIPA
jgi:hypothetical protein